MYLDSQSKLQKTNLRTLWRQNLKRREMDVERVAQEQTLLTKHLIDFLKRREGTWAAFMPLVDEPSPIESVKACSHIRWVFPLVEGNDLSFWIVNSIGDFNPGEFRKGAFGILEPDPKKSQPISIAQITGFLVPGLVFDRKGGRLGRGKGYYDRTLERTPGEKVGLAFSEQVTADELPREPWDIDMDVLVTDTEIKIFRGQGEDKKRK